MGTFLTRVLPFLLFPSHKNKTPLFITYLGKVLPFSIIGMLIVYCFQSVSPFSWPHGLPELAAAIFVISYSQMEAQYALQCRWRNCILYDSGSICVY
jgi:branched-subunit amino acid transport protein AzlD